MGVTNLDALTLSGNAIIGGTSTINGVVLGATETLTAAGAISLVTGETALALAGAGAVTLAAPTKNIMKIITMTADNGDVTLALTNVVGGTAATTCTFNDVNDILILVADLARAKWVVIKEVGVGMA